MSNNICPVAGTSAYTFADFVDDPNGPTLTYTENYLFPHEPEGPMSRVEPKPAVQSEALADGSEAPADDSEPGDLFCKFPPSQPRPAEQGSGAAQTPSETAKTEAPLPKPDPAKAVATADTKTETKAPRQHLRGDKPKDPPATGSAPGGSEQTVDELLADCKAHAGKSCPNTVGDDLLPEGAGDTDITALVNELAGDTSVDASNAPLTPAEEQYADLLASGASKEELNAFILEHDLGTDAPAKPAPTATASASAPAAQPPAKPAPAKPQAPATSTSTASAEAPKKEPAVAEDQADLRRRTLQAELENFNRTLLYAHAGV